jgi:uncharacterized membrane protein YwzB
MYACVDFVGIMLASSASSFLQDYVDFSEDWMDIANVAIQLQMCIVIISTMA